MGSTIGRIEKEFILNSVCDNVIPLRISAYKQHKPGLLKTLEYDCFGLSGDIDVELRFPVGGYVRVYFLYFVLIL